MHVFPVETARLRTRALSTTDATLFSQLYMDEETMRFIGAPMSAEQAARSFRAVLAGMRRSPIERLFLTVTEKTSGEDVGICSLQNCNLDRRSVQGGVMFVRGARARGYSTELFATLIQRAFAELPVDRLWVQFADGHMAVQRAVISVGFTRCQQAGVWSVRRDTWVAPAPHDTEMTLPGLTTEESCHGTRIPDDISARKQA